MFVTTTILIILTTNSVCGQAECQDDVQCWDGLFCERSTFSCRPCMDCSELNRSPLPQREGEGRACVKSDDDCGPCLESYTTSEWNSKCIVPENKSNIAPNVVWITCAAIGLLITGLFMHIVINTNVYEIVGYYVPIKQPMSLQTSIQGYPMTKINAVLIAKTQEIIA